MNYSDKLPIVFLHTGKHNYLKLTIERAKKSGNQVFLLGDESNKNFCTEWVALKKLYSKKIQEFEKIYVHMSSLTYKFELFCILRYFYLFEFMEIKKLDKAIMMDSDCLSYKTYRKDEYDPYDAAVECRENAVMPNASFWTKNALKCFIEYVEELYAQRIDSIKKMYQECYIGKNGGICDMTLLFLWLRSNPSLKVLKFKNDGDELIQYIPAVTEENKAIYEYDSFTRLLTIKFVSGVPHFLRNDGTMQKVWNLHLHGGKKMYIKPLSKENTNKIILYYCECKRRFKWAVVKRIYKQK